MGGKTFGQSVKKLNLCSMKIGVEVVYNIYWNETIWRVGILFTKREQRDFFIIINDDLSFQHLQFGKNMNWIVQQKS